MINLINFVHKTVSNKLFKIKENGYFEEIILETGLEPDVFGTGAAVADIDDDGILELLVSRGESK